MRRFAKFFVLLSVLILFFPLTMECATDFPRSLHPPNPVTGVSPVEKAHRYQILSQPGLFVRIGLHQFGTDLELTLFTPSGGLLAEKDSYTGLWGEEVIGLVFDEPGGYTLEVRNLEPDIIGEYRLTISEPRPPGPGDLALARTLRIPSEVERLKEKGNREAHQNALNKLREMRELYRIAGERRQVALSLLDEAEFYGYLLEPSKKIKAFEAALAIAEALEDHPLRALVHHNLGAMFYDNGDFERSIQHYDKALDLRPGSNSERAETLLAQGVTHGFAGRWQQAERYLEQARDIWTNHGQTRELARYHTQIGKLYQQKEQPELAVAPYYRALELVEDGKSTDRIGILDRLAVVLMELERYEEAETAFEQALRITPPTYDSWRANLQANLGELMVERKRYEESLPLLEEALEVLRIVNQRDAVMHTLVNLARAHRGLGDLARATDHMSEALVILEDLARAPRSLSMQADYTSSRYHYLDFYLDLSMEQGKADEENGLNQFLYFDRLRGRHLEKRLKGQYRQFAFEDWKKEQRFRELQIDLTLAVWRNEQRNGGGTGNGDAQVDQLLLEYEKLQSEAYAAGQEGEEISPLDWEALQNLIPNDGTAYLFYGLGEETIWLWWLDREGLDLFRIGDRKRIEADAREWHDRMKHRDTQRHKQRIEDLGARLAEALLGPVADKLSDRRLLISTDGALSLIPFGALPDPSGREVPLVTRNEIVYISSLSILAALEERAKDEPPRKHDQLLTAFQSPAYHPESGFATLRYSGHADIFASMPFAEKVEVYKGKDASKSTILEGVGDRSRVLHFGTHGLIYTQHSELSGLVLATMNEAGEHIDGYLRAFEIRTLDILAELVVLCACESALGKELRGEGLVGLSQAFLEAGARGVIVTGWSIEDEPTTEFMRYFYTYLHENQGRPADALRRAQLAMQNSERWSAPYYWAGFFYQGDWKIFFYP